MYMYIYTYIYVYTEYCILKPDRPKRPCLMQITGWTCNHRDRKTPSIKSCEDDNGSKVV